VMGEGWLLGPRNPCTRGKKKASTAACFVHLPGALVPFAGHAPCKVLRQRFGFLQVCRLAVLRPKLRLRSCISAFASRKSAVSKSVVSKPSVNCS
jgi:hypothetical protein